MAVLLRQLQIVVIIIAINSHHT